MLAGRGSTTEKVGLERLVAPAVVVEMRAAAAENPDALLEARDLERFEAEHGAIEPGTIVLVRTAWAERWPTASDTSVTTRQATPRACTFPASRRGPPGPWQRVGGSRCAGRWSSRSP